MVARDWDEVFLLKPGPQDDSTKHKVRVTDNDLPVPQPVQCCDPCGQAPGPSTPAFAGWKAFRSAPTPQSQSLPFSWPGATLLTWF